MSLLVFTIAALTTVWVLLSVIMIWMSLVFSAIFAATFLAGRFLKSDPASAAPASCGRRFVAVEALNGVCWATFAILMLGVSDPWATTYVMVVFLLVAAMHTVITALVPMAIYAVLAPVAVAIFGHMHPTDLNGVIAPLTMLACGTQLYFVVLAKRIYTSQLDLLAFQSEKDFLIAELEQAKANSDEARRRAEEANLAKSRFLATMSHELRTPLNAILGFSEVMKAELFGPHAVAAYRDYSNDIHASGEHLLMLINEILDLSRVEAAL